MAQRKEFLSLVFGLCPELSPGHHLLAPLGTIASPLGHHGRLHRGLPSSTLAPSHPPHSSQKNCLKAPSWLCFSSILQAPLTQAELPLTGHQICHLGYDPPNIQRATTLPHCLHSPRPKHTNFPKRSYTSQCFHVCLPGTASDLLTG